MTVELTKLSEFKPDFVVNPTLVALMYPEADLFVTKRVVSPSTKKTTGQESPPQAFYGDGTPPTSTE